MKKELISKNAIIIMICIMMASQILSCAKSSKEVSTKVETTMSVVVDDDKNASDIKNDNDEKNSGDKLSNITIDTNKNVIFDSDKTEKPIFINFWATWCGPCVGEMGELQKVYEEYKNSVDFVMINCGETKETIENFLVENMGEYTFPIGYDEDNAISDKFNIMAIPTTFVVDKNKNISKKLVGANSYENFKNEIEKVLN